MTTFVERITADKEGMRLFQQEKLILQVTELMSRRMKESDVTKAELARRLGKSKAYITQLLDGRANMTLRTVSDVLWALDRMLQTSDVPIGMYHKPVRMMDESTHHWTVKFQPSAAPKGQTGKLDVGSAMSWKVEKLPTVAEAKDRYPLGIAG